MSAGEPVWLTLYRAQAPAEDVAAAWLQGLEPEARREAEADAPTARARLRRAIVDSDCAEVRADAADSWRYTGSVLRAADAVLGIPPPRPSAHMSGPGRTAAPSGGDAPAVSRVVVPGEGRPGTLGVCWSDFGGATCLEQLRAKGVTRRLNVAAEAVKQFQEEGLPIAHVPMEDVFNEELSEAAIPSWVAQLGEAHQLMCDWREAGAVVNVSCQMGKNRSGAVILAWLCSECGWQMEPAVEHLRSVTFLACGNPHILKAVTLFLQVDVVVPLNPAGDGGGWICISPPGSPRAGATQAFEDTAKRALAQLAKTNPAANDAEGSGIPAGGGIHREVEQDVQSDGGQECGEIVPLFGDMPDDGSCEPSRAATGDLSDVD